MSHVERCLQVYVSRLTLTIGWANGPSSLVKTNSHTLSIWSMLRDLHLVMASIEISAINVEFPLWVVQVLLRQPYCDFRVVVSLSKLEGTASWIISWASSKTIILILLCHVPWAWGVCFIDVSIGTEHPWVRYPLHTAYLWLSYVLLCDAKGSTYLGFHCE